MSSLLAFSVVKNRRISDQQLFHHVSTLVTIASCPINQPYKCAVDDVYQGVDVPGGRLDDVWRRAQPNRRGWPVFQQQFNDQRGGSMDDVVGLHVGHVASVRCKKKTAAQPLTGNKSGQLQLVSAWHRALFAPESDMGVDLLSYANANLMHAAPNLHPKIICKIFGICSKKGYFDGELFEALATRLLDPSSQFPQNVGHVEIGMVMQTLGKMQRSNVPGGLFPSLTQLTELMLAESIKREERKTKRTHAALGDIVHGLGLVLRYSDNSALLPHTRHYLNTVLCNLSTETDIFIGSSSSFCKIIHGCANSGLRDLKELTILCDNLVEMEGRLGKGCVFNGFNGFELSNVAWSFGKLRFRHEKILELLGQAIIERVGELTPQGLSQVVYGLGQVAPVNRGVLYELCKEIQKKNTLELFTQQGLANIVYGLSQLGYKTPQVLDALGGEIAKDERRIAFKEQEIANIVYGFGKLRYTNKNVLEALCLEMVKTERLARFKEQELFNVIYGLCKAQYGKTNYLDLITTEALRVSRLSSFLPHHLAIMLYSLGILKYEKKYVFEGLCVEITRGSRLRSFSEQNLANIVYGLAQVNFNDMGILKALSDEITRGDRICSFKDQELSNIIFGLGKLRYSVHETYDALAEEVTRQLRIDKLMEQHLANVVYGLARGRYENTEVMEKLCGQVVREDRLMRFTEQQIATIVYSLGLMKYRDDDVTRALVDEMAREERRKKITAQNRETMVLGLSRILPPEEEFRPREFRSAKRVAIVTKVEL